MESLLSPSVLITALVLCLLGIALLAMSLANAKAPYRAQCLINRELQDENRRLQITVSRRSYQLQEEILRGDEFRAENKRLRAENKRLRAEVPDPFRTFRTFIPTFEECSAGEPVEITFPSSSAVGKSSSVTLRDAVDGEVEP